MKRVLYLAPTAEIGGAEQCLLDLLRRLPPDRFEAHLTVPREGPLALSARAAGTCVWVNPWATAALRVGREKRAMNLALIPFAPLLLLPAAVRLARYVRARHIDLLHTNGTKSHLLGLEASLMTGVPVVWHLRDVLAPGPLRSMIRLLGGLFPRRIIANSDATAASMASKATRRRMIRIYDGIDPDDYSPREMPPSVRSSLGISGQEFVIGSVGALAPLKGHIHLIGAMPRVLREIPGARLLIVGQEMYETMGHQGHRQQLEDEVARLGLGDRVIFAGHRDDIGALYGIMNILVLASVRPESFGRVLVEAMACQRPVISTDLGGPKEIISGPDVGVLVPAADSSALAGAIIELHHDPDRRERMGRSGRARVAASFNIERNVAEICSLYDAMTATTETRANRRKTEAAR